jgi:uncharacterized membrane protein
VSPPTRARLVSVDLLRGVVMVIMALDHTRDYFSASRVNPLDPDKTTLALYLTRWVTHFCAPTFVFLAGTGAFLSLGRGKPRAELSSFLLKRGLFLVVLEVTVVRIGWTFNFDYQIVWVQVIWALGVSMIVLGLLVRFFSDTVIGVFGVAMIALHNAFDGIKVQHQGEFLLGAPPSDWILAVLHERRAPVVYPVIPWIGVMAAGFAFGHVMRFDAERRRRTLARLGAALVAGFLVLRALAVYGDPNPWKPRADTVASLMVFFDVEKYPPSLLFLMITLGPMFLALAWLERAGPTMERAFLAYGRVPLFYYVAHIYLIHVSMVVAGVVTGYRAKELFVPFFMLPRGYGFSLDVVYAVWIAMVLGLYPACRWFAELKATRKDWWLGYM